MGLNRPITIGRIDYANAWPLFHEFEKHAALESYEIISRVPSELNRMLQTGELDLSAISSFSYGLNAKDYILLPHLSVGSIGNVNSILLFMKEPIEHKRPEKIAVTTTSATSVNLLKIIMAIYFECSPVYSSAEPELGSMLETSDAALIIGDPAIQASWKSDGYYVIDLGRLWNEWTGLGMTYAVVAARKEIVLAAPNVIQAVYNGLIASKQYNKAHSGPLIAHACSQLGGQASYWDMYFHSLQYDFGSKLQEGLKLYFRYSKELGLLAEDVELTFFEEQSAQ
ncbi:menaquinone biosynthesis protein [Paenibacillus alkaliterrae]|uniref:menaquinone biosynthetic enzyme MqnA/MqnD family protein n=1 Tax=Paenibacillus alkaliterrae TaxID=320909 RepID=UPI001F218670|nr:menaquinone biosynthesis protein [Paenibacillus alkaliterrae]MCF2937607.1 menaquinone biosynthesis protein [Paenibacillus alkaliterrae]